MAPTHDWLRALAQTRLGPAATDQEPSSRLVNQIDSLGRQTVTLQWLSPASSAAVSALLLQAFADTPGRAARVSQQQSAIEIVVQQQPACDLSQRAAVGGGEHQAPSGGQQGLAEHAGLQQDWAVPLLSIQFKAADPEAVEQAEEAARLFEAYWQYHLKAAKSDLHCRMRRRLTALRQQLMLTKVDSSGGGL